MHERQRIGSRTQYINPNEPEKKSTGDSTRCVIPNVFLGMQSCGAMRERMPGLFLKLNGTALPRHVILTPEGSNKSSRGPETPQAARAHG